MGLVLERVDELLEPARLEAPEQGGGSVTPPPCGSMTRRSLLSRAPDQR
jgi:hypothetical protein